MTPACRLRHPHVSPRRPHRCRAFSGAWLAPCARTWGMRGQHAPHGVRWAKAAIGEVRANACPGPPTCAHPTLALTPGTVDARGRSPNPYLEIARSVSVVFFLSSIHVLRKVCPPSRLRGDSLAPRPPPLARSVSRSGRTCPPLGAGPGAYLSAWDFFVCRAPLASWCTGEGAGASPITPPICTRCPPSAYPTFALA